jgi:hypothetical protein
MVTSRPGYTRCSLDYPTFVSWKCHRHPGLQRSGNSHPATSHGTPELHFPDGVKANHPYSSHPRAAGGRRARMGLSKAKRLLPPTGKVGAAALHPVVAPGQAAKPGPGPGQAWSRLHKPPTSSQQQESQPLRLTFCRVPQSDDIHSIVIIAT